MASGKYICIKDFGYYKAGCIYKNLPMCQEPNWFPLEDWMVTCKTPLTQKEINEHFEAFDSQRSNENQ